MVNHASDNRKLIELKRRLENHGIQTDIDANGQQLIINTTMTVAYEKAKSERIKTHALQKAGMTEQELTKAHGHGIECDCHTCRKFSIFLTIKEIIEEWER